MNWKDFFNSLLDLTFAEPLVKRFAPVLFVFFIAAVAAGELFQLLEDFATNNIRIIISGLIMTPIAILFWVIMARLLLDFLRNASQMAADMKRLERKVSDSAE